MHSGELQLHHELGVPKELTAQMPRWPESSMDAGRQLFFRELPYFALGTLDSFDRPWATCFVGRISCEPNRMRFESDVLPSADPVRASLIASQAGRPWAGVGLDYSNRRRNKVEGRVEVAHDAAPFVASLVVDKTMGNCPKYINVRKLVRVAPSADARTVRGRGALPAEAVAVVERADTLFMASRHLASNTMDVNHRGGPSGFVRTLLGGAQLVIPDFSGNRIFSSLGNIRSDGCAGLCVPDFVSGDVLERRKEPL